MNRDDEGRLFPVFAEAQGWEISAQADAHGYACTPKKRLDDLNAYETVEVLLRTPFCAPAVLTDLDGLEDLFSPLDGTSSLMATHFPTDKLDALRNALFKNLMRDPNYGTPKGADAWPGQTLFHGTNAESAQDIAQNGIDLGACTAGYFGRGFYMADEEDLARSNYADFQKDGEAAGRVISAQIADGAVILDMRNADDQRTWDEGNFVQKMHLDTFPKIMRTAGIDGIYDRSFGGVVIYSPNALVNIQITDSEPEMDHLDF